MSSAFFSGYVLSFGLILAIGAQNAFVLRQGIRRQHVLAVCLTCALSDAVLITAGVAGFGGLATAMPWFEPLMRYGGAAFLIWYGARSLHAALTKTEALVTGEDARQGGGAALRSRGPASVSAGHRSARPPRARNRAATRERRPIRPCRDRDPAAGSGCRLKTAG